MHEEDVLSLVGRAEARRRFPDLGFSDPAAENVLTKLELDAGRFDDRRLRASMMRTMVVDGIVRQFFERHPQGLAVALNPGLCTRFSRMDNGVLRWIELEPPGFAEFKSSLFDPSERHIIATCCSVGCTGWMRRLRGAEDVPTILIAQGALLRAHVADRDAFFLRAAEWLPAGTELVMDYDAKAPIRPSSLRANVSLEVGDGCGGWARFPRMRFVSSGEYAPRLAHELSGLNAVSRLFKGNAGPSVAHLRFV
ncbi:tetracenomycin C synthesis protein [Labilithrix luteola]|uniref:Tetracenomycin C synthesis protein n=1 Tax=Labilithrix luteola TaxID=1391654 RepID=A0A0K1QEF6_9BACT|nr:tetracenomycin C synthesis protein [Labilithrix luteola]